MTSAMRSFRPAVLALVVSVFAIPTTSHARRCPADSVQVGDVCVDRYEASVWSTTDTPTIRKIQKGKIASAVGIIGTQHGASSDDYGAGCPDNAAGCVDYYAVSVAGVAPSGSISWFQATAACRNSGKRLLTNAEWQAAALGTPDPGSTPGAEDCNTNSSGRDQTGARSNCISNAGAFDMVGNLHEWVADWIPRSTACAGWGGFSDDQMCFSGASTTALGPGAVIRGGDWADGGVIAGPFAVDNAEPWVSITPFGFRCARAL